MSDFDPFLMGAAYGIAKNQQRAADPNLHRHSHGPGHYHAHVGSDVLHFHPVEHSMDWVPAAHREAWERGQRTFTHSNTSNAVVWGGLLGFIVGMFATANATAEGAAILGAMVVFVLGGITLWYFLGMKEYSLLQYVDGGSSYDPPRNTRIINQNGEPLWHPSLEERNDS